MRVIDKANSVLESLAQIMIQQKKTVYSRNNKELAHCGNGKGCTR